MDPAENPGSNPVPDDDAGSLATIIKSVHTDLRKRVLSGESPERVWNEHSSNSKRLKVYAEAMESLATQHWTKHQETRIDWVHDYISTYFSKAGLLKKLLDKSRRKVEFHTTGGATPPTSAVINSSSSMSTSETSTELFQSPVGGSPSLADSVARSDIPTSRPCCGKIYQDIASYNEHCKAVEEKQRLVLDPALPLLLRGGGSQGEVKIRTLDVGSCYAPFSQFYDLHTLSLDICPANKNVVRCDFLNVGITTRTDCKSVLDDCLKTASTDETTSINSLVQESFHVVVFSLVLGYMPTCNQRLQCCINAHRCLSINGILIIVTPDSNKQHRRVQQMKDWKTAIEALGFQRCHYEKQQHIHCLVFRKVTHSVIENSTEVPDTISSLLYIPQDFNTELDG